MEWLGAAGRVSWTVIRWGVSLDVWTSAHGCAIILMWCMGLEIRGATNFALVRSV